MLLRVGILGDFKPGLRNHQATNDALQHAADVMGRKIGATWLPTATPALGMVLRQQDAILAAPGSPYQSMDGMLAGIGFARRSGTPFLGTCGGFQYALIEYARAVLGLSEADSEENDRTPTHRIISPVACPVPDRGPGAPNLSGTGRLSIKPGTRLATVYDASTAEEEYFCNFEVNPEYVSAFEVGGMVFSASGEHGEARAAELPSHPFFIATLFQPQLGSTEGHPHPLITAFLEAAANCQANRTELARVAE